MSTARRGLRGGRARGQAGLGSVFAVWRSGSRREGAAIPAASPGGCWPPSPRHSSLFTLAAGGPAPRRGTGRGRVGPWGPPGRALRDWGRSVTPGGLGVCGLPFPLAIGLWRSGDTSRISADELVSSLSGHGAACPRLSPPDPAPPLPADPPA